MVETKCPNCGANIKVENNNKTLVCEHCGAKFLLEDVVNKYQTVNQYNTTQNIVKNIYGHDTLETADMIRNADVFVTLGEFSKAENLYTQVINANPADWRGWFGFVRIKTKNFTDLADTKHLEYLEKARKVADNQQKTEIDNIYSEYLQKIKEEKERQRKIEEERIREQQKREIEGGEEGKRRNRRFAITLAILLPILILLFVLVPIVYGVIEKKTYCFGDYGKYVEKYNVSEFVIPEGVTNIDNGAFSGCNTLTQIVIPNGVTSIGAWAFKNCSSLTEVVMPDSITIIEMYAFEGCDSLTQIVIPNSITSIGEGAFRNCSSLTNIKVDANNATYKDIDGNLYSKDGTTLLQYANGKTATAFVVPDSVTSIGEEAFYSCDSLTTVRFGDNSQLTSIGYEAFRDCDSLTEIVIPASVTSIGYDAFYNCDSLTEIVIPASVTSIGSCAFYDCDSLTEIVIPASVTSIGYCVFEDCTSLTIYCEEASKPSGWSDSWNYSNRPVVWGYEYAKQNGIMYGIKDGFATIISLSSKNDIDSITIPNSIIYKDSTYAVTCIEKGVFKNCESLTEITLPFVGAALNGTENTHFGYIFGASSYLNNSSYVPKSLKKVTITGGSCIGNSAFYNCDSLTTVIFGENSQLNVIDSYAFYDCDALREIEIPNSVTAIGQKAFSACGVLTKIAFRDITTWYNTTSFIDWDNKTGGMEISVTSISQNATRFQSYDFYYWYKK